MNREDVIRLAKEAGIGVEDDSSVPVWHMSVDYLERFANLVAAAEREACANVCDDLDDDIPDGLAGWQFGEAIRARGEK